ncbi:MAG: hypothetical protein ACFCVH_06680 [Alphaproteobacteria bacterium]
MKVMIGALLLLVAAAGVPLAAQDYRLLSGDYLVEGQNPDGASGYQGMASITATGDTFQVEWNIGEQLYFGTGIAYGEVLSVGYDGGTAYYQIGKDGVLHGLWTTIGSDRLGTEILTPIFH